MDESLNTVTIRSGVADLHAAAEHPVIRRVLAHGPEAPQMRLLRLALLVPLSQPLRQFDGTANFNVNDVGVGVVCSHKSGICIVGESYAPTVYLVCVYVTRLVCRGCLLLHFLAEHGLRRLL